MTENFRKVNAYDENNTQVYISTLGEIVKNKQGDNLGDVEAGAQVNVLEKIKVNGTELTIVQKAVDITIPTQSEYTIAKLETAETGYAHTYVMTKDGTQVGAKINIPKDLVVQSGSVQTCSTANVPVQGYKKGDKYIDLVLANADNQHIYILVSDLVDTYTQGNGITINNNQISIDTAVVALKSDLPTKTSELTNDSGFLTQHQDISGKANAADLATVATSGNYNDLTNKPTIPAAQVNADWNATSGVAQILNKPAFLTYRDIVE